ncbi:Metallothionein expression activator [Thoreauomyces humboldtii]|nr:Metallothionein expression activator [Thoreauomyces humboldtii]
MMATVPWQYSESGWPSSYSSGEDDVSMAATSQIDYTPRGYMFAAHGNIHEPINHHNMGHANVFANSSVFMPTYGNMAADTGGLPVPRCHQHPYVPYVDQNHFHQQQLQQSHQHYVPHHTHHHTQASHHLSLLTTSDAHQEQQQHQHQHQEAASSYSYDSDTSDNEPVIVSPRDLMCVPRNPSPTPPLSTCHWTATGRRLSMDAMASGECATVSVSTVPSSVSSPSSLTNRTRQDAYLLAPSPVGVSVASVDSKDSWCRLPPTQGLTMGMRAHDQTDSLPSDNMEGFQHPTLMEHPFLNLATMPRSCAPSECDGEGDAESSDKDKEQAQVKDDTTDESELMEDVDASSAEMDISTTVPISTSPSTSTSRRIPVNALPSPPRDDSPSIDSTFDSSSDEAYQSSDDEDYADSGSDNDKDNDYEPFPSTVTFSISTITTTTATKKKAPRKCHRSPPTDTTLSSSTSNIVPVVSDWTRTSDGRYECPQHDCDKTFVRKFNGMTHYATHFDVRQFACRHCPRTFTRSYDLKRHCKLHQMGKQGSEDGPIVARKSRGPLKPRRSRSRR